MIPIALKKIAVPLDALDARGSEFDFGTIETRLELEEDRIVLERISARVKIDIAGDQYLAQIWVLADGSWTCDRCGTSFQRELSGSIKTLFSPEASEEEDDVRPLLPGTRELDLTQDVVDAILLAVPYQLLCREDCAGLCAQCKADLNKGPCSCTAPSDSRWDDLKKIRFET